MHGEAAIDGDRDSRDERSFIGHEESHGVGDILGLPWARDEGVTQKGTLHLCGELCAQRLQSQFMGNVRETQLRRSGS